MTGTPMVAASPERHDGGLQANPVEVQSYQPPWKVLSDFALQSDIDQPAFQQLVSVGSQPEQASLSPGQSNGGFSKRAGCPQRDEQSRLAGLSWNCKVGMMALLNAANWIDLVGLGAKSTLVHSGALVELRGSRIRPDTCLRLTQLTHSWKHLYPEN